MTTKIATVTITEDVRAAGTILYAGTYRVEMPVDYEPAAVTGEDILLDDAVWIVAEEGMREYDALRDEAEALLDDLYPEAEEGTLEADERPKAMGDALANSWVEGMTARQWADAAARRLGVVDGE